MKPLQMKLNERIEKVENYHVCDPKYAACLVANLANMKIVHYMEKHEHLLKELSIYLRIFPDVLETMTYQQVAKEIGWLYANGNDKERAYLAMRCLVTPIVALMHEKE